MKLTRHDIPSLGIIVCALLFSACALESAPDVLYLDAVTVAVGDTATVWLHSGPAAFHALQMTVLANDAIAEAVGVIRSPALRRMELFRVNMGSAFVVVAAAGSERVEAEGALLGIRYVGRQAGETSVSVRELQFDEREGGEVVGGMITVE